MCHHIKHAVLQKYSTIQSLFIASVCLRDTQTFTKSDRIGKTGNGSSKLGKLGRLGIADVGNEIRTKARTRIRERSERSSDEIRSDLSSHRRSRL